MFNAWFSSCITVWLSIFVAATSLLFTVSYCRVFSLQLYPQQFWLWDVTLSIYIKQSILICDRAIYPHNLTGNATRRSGFKESTFDLHFTASTFRNSVNKSNLKRRKMFKFTLECCQSWPAYDALPLWHCLFYAPCSGATSDCQHTFPSLCERSAGIYTFWHPITPCGKTLITRTVRGEIASVSRCLRLCVFVSTEKFKQGPNIFSKVRSWTVCKYGRIVYL